MSSLKELINEAFEKKDTILITKVSPIREAVEEVLEKLQISNQFEGIFDIKMANYIPKPEIQTYEKLIETYNINPNKTIMFDDIAKNLVPASKKGFTTVWINVGHENFSDDIASSKKYLDHQTKNLSNWLSNVNMSST